MADLTFADSHNMVAYLKKSEDNADFAEMVDFLNASPIRYALTMRLSMRRERGDSVERADTTATSLDAEQGSGNINRTQSTSNEPPLSRVNTLRSGEDSMKLHELTDLCTKLSDRVLDLENLKDAQALEIKKLKKRVKKLGNKKKSRTPQLKRRLFKVRIESSAEKSLGDQEDKSKQRRNEIDQDEGIACTSITTANINITTAEPVTTASAPVTTAGVSVSTAEPSTPPPTTTTPIEYKDLTIAQTLMKMKNKGKAKMVEPEKPKKKKDHIEYDANIAQRLQAELDEESRLEKEREEEANYELAAKLQAEEQGEISIEERSKLFVELMNERKKHFARLRAEEQRRKPLTKAQKRNQMSNYLKTMVGDTLQQLRGYSFDKIKTFFETTMRKVNIFVLIESEVDRAVPELAAGSSKRAAEEELDQESSKRQKTGESSKLAEEPRDKEADERRFTLKSQSSWWIKITRCPENFLGRYSCKLKDQEDEVFARIFSDLQGHSLRSIRVFEYILLMKIKLLIKKLEDLEVTTAGWSYYCCSRLKKKFEVITTASVILVLPVQNVTTARRVYVVSTVITGLSRMMDHAGVSYTSDLDFQIPYQRRVRRRTDDANTLAPQQPDP
ncbi:hypothetical protein Tco_1539696 [Tanacetum coccineum]